MNLYLIPHLMATLTFVAINVCFVMAASSGHIPWCFPYLEGCVSISKASRHAPEVQIYSIAIMTSAVLMVGYWVLCGSWLRQLYNDFDPTGSQSQRKSRRWVFVYVGIIASVGLAVNAALIGDSEGVFNDIRREGVRVFFIGSVLAQCMFALKLNKLVKQNNLHQLNKMNNLKIALCAGQLMFAILFAFIAPFFNHSKNIENIAEWNIVLLMLIFFVSTGISWKQTRFQTITANTLTPR